MNSQINQEGKERWLKIIKRFEKSPLSFLIRKRRLTFLIIAFLILVGFFQIANLPRELNPEVEIPIGIVITPFPGASSLDVEEQVTKEIESRVSEIDGIKTLSSSSGFGVSNITVEFEADQDLTESIRNLKDKVDESIPDLPEDALDPQVIEVNVNDVPVLAFSLQGAAYDKSKLKEFAEDIRDELRGISNVSDVEVVGGEDKIIEVNFHPDRLSEFGLDSNTILSRIRAANINFPAGSIEVGEFNYAVRVGNEFQGAKDVADLIIGQRGDVKIRVKDVADVGENFEEKTTISRISINGVNGGIAEETVSIQVFKRTGGDITKIAQEAKLIVEEAKGTLYPQDVQIVITTDTAKVIEESINNLSQNGLGTVFIILVLLIIFLGFREAFITSLAVPFSFFIAFMVMALFDQSLNFITLFSLVLALGLLVDSAVVIVEGTFEKITKYKMSGYGAAMCSVEEYAAPLTSGMLTTVAAFFPLLFVTGIFGEFLKGIPIVVIATLISALFVSTSIIPTIAATFLKPRERSEKEVKRKNILARGLDALSKKYKNSIYGIISKRRNRIAILVGAWVLFFISLIFPITGILKLEAFSAGDSETYWVNLTMPEGTVLEKTDQVVKEIEQRLVELPEIENFVSSVGTQLSFDIGGGGGAGSNTATVTVNLTKKDSRKITSTELTDQAREKLKEFTQGDIEIIEEQGGPPTGFPLEAKISGPDLVQLEVISQRMVEILDSVDGTTDVRTDLNFLPGEFVIKLEDDALDDFGLTVIQVAGELRNVISGDDNEDITRDGDEIKIKVVSPKDTINNIDSLRNTAIPTPTGERIALGELGAITIEPSISSINRIDEERTVRVIGRNERGFNINEIMAEYQRRLEQELDLPGGYLISYGGVSQEQTEVYVDMFQKMIIGIILILFILVAQFNSFRQVLIIMFTIPLAMIGVIWGLTLAGLILDIPAFIGIVSLSGIVVNNAIILIDYINKLRKERGVPLIKAAAVAGHARMRPIILTTTTTVIGLLPLSITQPEWRNMGFSIIFGLTFSTLLTLFVVPSLYVSLETVKKKK